jgi:hypothetical protein
VGESGESQRLEHALWEKVVVYIGERMFSSLNEHILVNFCYFVALN